jgi:signal transduction histidine kinase/CheY-like chemotaxis protein
MFWERSSKGVRNLSSGEDAVPPDDNPAGGPASGNGVSAEAKWADRLVGAGSLLTLLYQIAYLALDKQFLSLSHPRILIFHLINITLFGAAVIMTLNVGPWMRSHWKQVAFAFSTIMIASTTYITILTGQTQPLFIALILFLAGTGPFLSWGEQTQALLSMVAFLAFGVSIACLPNSAFDPYQGLGILIAAAIGLFSTALERRLRRARRVAEAEVLKGRETLMLQERLRLAGQLTSGIAHDLNNTLNVMKLRLAALSRDEIVEGRHAERLRALDRAIDDATRTVARVREFGKSRDEDRVEPVQLGEIIAQAIELARSSVEGRPALSGASIQIVSKVSDLLSPVRGPASDLRQVFLNLLLNAADAVNRQGEITVDSTIEDSAVVVRVSDNGAGIPPEHIDRIFEPFFTTKGAHGTGLGLSSAREIMESIGGSISAVNRAGGGAVFVLRFPLVKPRAEAAGAQAPADVSGGCRFLLVDDDAENLDSLKEILVRDGHQADTALSGRQALEKIRSNPAYDVILCDLGMPGLNGWEVEREARQIAGHANFYIVTGWGREIERPVAPSGSVSGVLSKPIDLNEIRQIAAGARAHSRSLGALAGSEHQDPAQTRGC